MERKEPVERVRERLPADIATAYVRCLDGSLEAGAALLLRVRAYLAEVRALARTEEFVDVATATTVARHCEALLARLDSDAPSGERRAVQAAVEYFVLADDVEDDTGSVIGFDDDLLVARATAQVLGWPLPGIDG